MNKKNRVVLKTIFSMMLCTFVLLISENSVHAQSLLKTKEQPVHTLISNGTVDENGYVYGTVVIVQTLGAGDPNADVENDGVRLRSAPSTSSTVLELMYAGETVSVDFVTSNKKSDGSWYYVKRLKTGTWGWTKAQYINCWD